MFGLFILCFFVRVAGIYYYLIRVQQRWCLIARHVHTYTPFQRRFALFLMHIYSSPIRWNWKKRRSTISLEVLRLGKMSIQQMSFVPSVNILVHISCKYKSAPQMSPVRSFISAAIHPALFNGGKADTGCYLPLLSPSHVLKFLESTTAVRMVDGHYQWGAASDAPGAYDLMGPWFTGAFCR